MSAEAAIVAAIREALTALPLNATFEAMPARAREPFAVVEPGAATDWSCKDRRGVELRPTVTIVSAADEAGELRGLMADAIDAVDALPRAVPGWRIASCTSTRSRSGAERPGRWRGTIEWRIRVMEDL
jgi:hypothetical protein